MPYTQEASIRTHYKRLARFIRLLDSMYQEAKLEIVKHTLSKLIEILGIKEIHKGKYISIKGKIFQYFKINAVYSNSKVEFSPSLDEVKEIVISTINKGISLVCSQPPLIDDPRFEDYLVTLYGKEDKNVEDRVDLLTLVENDPYMQMMKARLDSLIREIFDLMIKYSTNFDPILQIIEDSNKRNFEDLKGADAYVTRDWIKEFNSQELEVRQFEEIVHIGVLTLDCAKFKEEARSAPLAKKNYLNTFIPDYTNILMNSLMDELRNIDAQLLKTKNGTLKEYVEFMTFLREKKRKEMTYLDIDTKCKDLHSYMVEYKLTLAPKHKNRQSEVHHFLVQIRQKIDKAIDLGERSEPQFKRELEKMNQPIKLLLDGLLKELSDEKFVKKTKSVDKMVEDLNVIGEKRKDAEDQVNQIGNYSEFFQLDRPVFDSYITLNIHFQFINLLWASIKEWKDKLKVWKQWQFKEIDDKKIIEEAENYLKICEKIIEKFTELEFLITVPQHFQDKIEKVKKTAECIESLRKSYLEEWHWNSINDRLKFKIVKSSPDLVFNVLLKNKVGEHKAFIQNIAANAESENQVQKTFEAIKESIQKLPVKTKQFKERKEEIILYDKKKLSEKIEETLFVLNKTLGNKHVGPLVKPNIMETYKQLALTQEILEDWRIFQKKWKSLESLFKTTEIQTTLVNEYKQFSRIDKEFKALSKKAEDHLNINKRAAQKTLAINPIEFFPKNNKVFEEIYRSLQDFMISKCLECPRFFFLSEEELVQIYGDIKNPDKVLPYLPKLFGNIQKIEFYEENKEEVKLVETFEKEQFIVGKGCYTKATDNKYYISNLDLSIKRTMNSRIRTAYEYFFSDSFKRPDFIKSYMSQVVQLLDCINYTYSTDLVLEEEENMEDNLDTWYDEILQAIQDNSILVQSKEFTTIQKLTIVNLLIQEVHFRDVIRFIIDENVRKVNHFKWQQQIRYYFTENFVNIKQLSSTIDYAYELYGCSSRLVSTPNTDRCFLAINCALKNRLSTLIVGPDGSAKSEIVLDLAKTFAKLCIIFKASENISFKALNKMVNGVVSVGAWICITNLEAIPNPILSIFGQVLHEIKHAFLTDYNPENIMINGRLIKVGKYSNANNPLSNCLTISIFGTLKEIHLLKGFPITFKNLYRIITVSLPNIEFILQTLLFVRGFKEYSNLCTITTSFLSMLNERLPSRKCYEFNLTKIKALINEASTLRERSNSEPENDILKKAIINVFYNNIIPEDINGFKTIIDVLFPEEEPKALTQRGQNHIFTKYIDEAFRQINLTPNKLQAEIAFNLYTLLQTSKGIILTGPSLCGKTAITNILQQLYKEMKKEELKPLQNIDIYEFFIQSPTELIGNYSADHNEWNVGVLSSKLKHISRQKNENIKIVLLDGPIHPDITDRFVPMIDYRKELSLPNGEIVKLSDEIKIIFETDTIEFASPGFIARNSILPLTQTNLDAKLLIEAWLKKIEITRAELIDKKLMDFIKTYIEKTLYNLLTEKSKFSGEIIPCSLNNSVITFCTLFETLFSRDFGVTIDKTFDVKKKIAAKIIVFSLSWAISGSMEAKLANRIDTYMITTINPGEMPKGPTLYNNIKMFDTTFGEFVPWESMAKEFKYIEETRLNEIIIPTRDFIRYSYILRLLSIGGRSSILTGPVGSGKSLICKNAQYLLNSQDSFAIFSRGMTSKSTAGMVYSLIEEKMEKRRKNLLAGPNGQKVAIFLDDLNLPRPKEGGRQKTLEFIRQILNKKGYYDQDKMFWKGVEDLSLINAASIGNSGRPELSYRLLQNMSILYISTSQFEQLLSIYEPLISKYLAEGFSADIKILSNPLVTATIALLESCSLEIVASPHNPHYIFSATEAHKIFAGILSFKKSSFSHDKEFIKVWAHECGRTIGDRVTKKFDLKTAQSIINKQLESTFKSELRVSDLESFNYTFLLIPDLNKDSSKLEIPINGLETFLKTKLEEYNKEKYSKLFMLINNEVTRHIAKVYRAISLAPLGLILVSPSPYNHFSLVELSCFIAKRNCVKLGSNISNSEFKETIQNILKSCILESHPVTIFINSNILNNIEILSNVNKIIMQNQLLTLFSKETLTSIEDRVCNNTQNPVSKDDFKEYVIKKITENLSLVISYIEMDKFREIVKISPSLVNKSFVIFISPLTEIEKKQITQVTLSEFFHKQPEINIEKLSGLIYHIDSTVREEVERINKAEKKNWTVSLDKINEMCRQFFRNYVSFKELVENRNSKLEKCIQSHKMIVDGLDNIEKDILDTKPKLLQKIKDTEQLYKKFNKDQLEFTKKKAMLEEDENKFRTEFKVETSCDDELIQYTNLFMQSKNDIKAESENLSIAHSMKSDKENKKVLQPLFYLVYSLLGQEVKEKEAMNSISVDLLKTMVAFNPSSVSVETQKSLMQKLEKKKELTAEKCLKISPIVFSIYNFVISTLQIVYESSRVTPKEPTVDMVSFQERKDKMAERRKTFKEEKEMFEKLEKEFIESKKEKEFLDQKNNLLGNFQDNAQKLLKALPDELNIWTQESESLTKNVEENITSTLIYTAIVTYLGPFNLSKRDSLIKNWTFYCKSNSISVREPIQLINCLYNNFQPKIWNNLGLPNNIHLLNSVSIYHLSSKNAPLIIDTSEMFERILKSKIEKEIDKFKFEIQIIKQNDPQMLQKVKKSIKSGEVIFFNEIKDYINPILDPLIYGEFTKVNNKNYVKIEKDDIEVHNNFKMFFISNIPFPSIPSQYHNRFNVIDFTYSQDTIREILISELSLKDNSENELNLIEKSKTIVLDKEKITSTGENLMNKILEWQSKLINDSENANMICEYSSTLQNMRMQLEISISEYEKMKTSIRSKFLEITNNLVCLYESIDNIQKLNSMYFMSFFSFLNKIKSLLSPLLVPLTIKELPETLIKTSFNNYSLGLFNKDKKLFALFYITTVQKFHGKISNITLDFLLNLKEIQSTEKSDLGPSSQVISKDIWNIFAFLSSKLVSISEICEDILKHVSEYENWISSPDIINAAPPEYLAKRNNSFIIAIIVKMIYPNLFRQLINWIIAKELPPNYLDETIPKLKTLLEQGSNKAPIIYIHNVNANPVPYICKYLYSIPIAENEEIPYSIIDASDPNASLIQKNLETIKGSGKIALIINCHLAPKLIPLIKEVLEVNIMGKGAKIMDKFRVILTTCSCSSFPISILSDCTRIAIDLEDDLKRRFSYNLRSIEKINDFDNPRHPQEILKLGFGLSFLHALINERKKYFISNSEFSYDLNECDLKTTYKILAGFINTHDTIIWRSVKDIVDDVFYGGAISEETERLVLSCISNPYINPNIVEKNYVLSDSQIYKIPDENDFDTYINYANQLPEEDEYDIFQLHPRYKGVANNLSNTCLQQGLLGIYFPNSSLSKTEIKEDQNLNEMINNIIPKIHETLNLQLIKEELLDKVKGLLDPFSQYLLTEISKYNQLNLYIRDSLNNLSKCLKCNKFMDEEMSLMQNSLALGKIPIRWIYIGFPSAYNIAQYIDSLFKRMEYISKWMETGHPKSFNLQFLFSPLNLLNCFSQKVIRKYQLKLVSISYNIEFQKIEWGDEKTSLGEEDLYVYGAYICNGMLSQESFMLEDEIEKVDFNKVPAMKFSLVDVQLEEENIYKCPLYRAFGYKNDIKANGIKPNFLLKINCLSNIRKEYWMTRKTAMYLEIPN